MNNKTSVIIPSRRECFLNQTIQEVKTKFAGDYEIIVVLDGEDAERIEGVQYIWNRKAKGMRTCINQGVAVSTGKYLFKLDAHCLLDKGIDEKLKEHHRDKWVQIPRRKRLDAHRWKIKKTGEPDIDYMYINKDLMGVKCHGKNLNKDLKEIVIDDTEVFQGSCYFIDKKYFLSLGLLDNINFGGSGHEATEIALKARAAGGRVVRNKTTFYAHARLGRHYTRHDNVADVEKSRKYIKELYKKIS